MLMEVLRKLWAALEVQQVKISLQKTRDPSLNQHGYLPKRGMDTAKSQVIINTLEKTAWNDLWGLLGYEQSLGLRLQASTKPSLLATPQGSIRD